MNSNSVNSLDTLKWSNMRAVERKIWRSVAVKSAKSSKRCSSSATSERILRKAKDTFEAQRKRNFQGDFNQFQ